MVKIKNMQEKDIGYLMKNINDRLKTRADADLGRYNLTFAQSRVFGFLNSCGGAASQKDIERYLEVSHPTVVGLVSRLEQRGFVLCRVDAADRRNKIVELTEQARTIGQDMERSVAATEAELLSGLSASDVDELRRMLTVMYGNLEQKS